MSHTPDVWPIVHAERARLVDDLDDLPPEAWTTPSLCPGWDVHDVLAHLIDSATTTRLGFVRRMAVARFDFDRDNETGIRKNKRADPAATVDAMRAVISRTSTPPASSATRLVEAFVHGEDIRRPLGIDRHYPPSAVAHALRYQAKTSAALGGGRERADDLRLVATDTDLEYGSGPTVSGTAIDLLLAVSGRPVAVGALAGSGAALLGTRQAT
ncbi:maleylpyruvate isomerase family mycothiol-dependent enzyme [Gordonia sp. SL306]|uniref:maleylpyruvate isomerase family mycothiol-dependent enzyme n=1 Tax=Gordonia sp. SL306 TaxID=2995145 RepID=UPI00226FCC15|nr:maleylpyruvate isomerase family mycothiol-dependent enzyme [Gordonia sp. SL306]WAC53843.1 maleylpyruvate isomerase family mycothiol-dependent enzyme [Gordonia sp. SL306]